MFSRKAGPEPVMLPVSPCPDCGQQRVPVSGSAEMNIYPPDGGRPLSELQASACLGCGRVYFYMARLDRLRARYGG